MQFLVFALTLGLLFLFAIWRAMRPQPAFVITWRDGKLRVVRGKAPHAFLQACRDLLSHHEIEAARIAAYPMERRSVTLRFSKSIPERLHQRFRNAIST